MHAFVININKILKEITSFDNYLTIIPATECAVFAAIFLLGVFFKKIRLTDKTALTLTSLATFAFLAAKSIADNAPREDLSVSLTIAAVAFLLLAALTIQQKAAIKAENNAVPDPDYLGDELPPSLAIKALTELKKRRTNVLPTEKLFEKKDADFEVNYSEILALIAKIQAKTPDFYDEKTLTELKADVEKYSSEKMEDADRRLFSSKLSALIKLMAKYGA